MKKQTMLLTKPKILIYILVVSMALLFLTPAFDNSGLKQVVTFDITRTVNAQTTAKSEIKRGDDDRIAGKINSAILAYANAKRLAHEKSEHWSMLTLSNRYLLMKKEWDAQDTFGLAFRYSYDMAIGEPAKTGIPRNCRSGRFGLKQLESYWKSTLSKMKKSKATEKQMLFIVKEATDATNWLNDNHGAKGCPYAAFEYQKYPNKILMGGTRKTFRNKSVEFCKKECDKYDWCYSVQYIHTGVECQLKQGGSNPKHHVNRNTWDLYVKKL